MVIYYVKYTVQEQTHALSIHCRHVYNTALIWQKEASDKSEISRKRAKCVCHLH